MSVIPQTPKGSGAPPVPPTRALPSTRWGPKSGPQTPRLLTPPLTTNPGSVPGYIMAVSFISAGNRNNGRKPPTGRKLLTNESPPHIESIQRLHFKLISHKPTQIFRY